MLITFNYASYVHYGCMPSKGEKMAMKVVIVPVIPWHKDTHDEIKRALEKIRPEYVLTDLGPDDEPDNVYQMPLVALGRFSERSYAKTLEELSHSLNFKVVNLSPEYEEILKEVSKRANVIEIIRYNMLLRRIQRPSWRDVISFLKWLYKSFYKIDIMRGEAYAFSKKVKVEIEKLGRRVIAIVCDFLMLQALVDVLGNEIKVYDEFSSEDFTSMMSLISR